MKKLKLSKMSANMLQTVIGLIVIYIVMMIMSATGNISNSLSNLLIQLCIYAIAAVALNLCVGFLGELSLGHAGFMSVGAFGSALFSNATADIITQDTLRFFLALLFGMVLAAVFGFIIGIPVLRLNGDYLAIVTLAFGEIIKGLLNVTYVGKDDAGIHFAMLDNKSIELGEGGKMIINGAKGVTGTPHLATFTISMLLLIIVLVLSTFLVNSRSGRAIMAIRDNRIAAESVGLNITRFKMIAFTISATIAGVAGALYSHYLSALTATKFDFNMSILFLVFVVLGGIGNFRGSIIAAVVLTALPEVLRGMSSYRMLIYAVLLIVMMLLNWAPAALDARARLKEKIMNRKKEV